MSCQWVIMMLLENAETEIINVRYVDEVVLAKELFGVDRPTGVRSLHGIVQVFGSKRISRECFADV
jgi:hypothetical protein